MASAQWVKQAMALSDKHGVTGRAFKFGTYANGHVVTYRVRSESHDGQYYSVDVTDGAWDSPRCHCTAASFGRPCKHAGAVIHLLLRQDAKQAAREASGDVTALDVQTYRCMLNDDFPAFAV